MAIYSTNDGAFVASDENGYLPGAFTTKRAAVLALGVDRRTLSAAWEAKRLADGTIPDDGDFTECEIEAMQK